MSDTAPQGGCRATAFRSSRSDLQHMKPVSPGHNSEACSSYEIFNSAIGELSKQNLNNSQYIDQIGKKLISGGGSEGGNKNMTLGSITDYSFFPTLISDGF
jgi:hypothetical protein